MREWNVVKLHINGAKQVKKYHDYILRKKVCATTPNLVRYHDFCGCLVTKE